MIFTITRILFKIVNNNCSKELFTSFPECFFNSLGISLGMLTKRKGLRTIADRILIGTMSLFAFFLTSQFSSSLYTTLATVEDFSNMNTFAELNQSSLNLYVYKDEMLADAVKKDFK